jgi:hypothetical protein
MKNRFAKVALFAAFGLVMALVGAVAINRVSAQVAMNCDSSSSSFWGFIACYIGSPTQGITGADTLFKGQKALSDKIAAIPAGGSTSAAGGSQVYLERTINGAVESTLLGTVAKSYNAISQIFWGCLDAGVSSATLAPDRILSSDCPSTDDPVKYGVDKVTVVFQPSQAKLQEYTIRGGIKPTLCYTQEKHESDDLRNVSDGKPPTNMVRVYCTYAPTMCQYNATYITPSTNIAYRNCATMAERSKLFYNYETNPVSQDQRYRIVIK